MQAEGAFVRDAQLDNGFVKDEKKFNWDVDLHRTLSGVDEFLCHGNQTARRYCKEVSPDHVFSLLVSTAWC